MNLADQLHDRLKEIGVSEYIARNRSREISQLIQGKCVMFAKRGDWAGVLMLDKLTFLPVPPVHLDLHDAFPEAKM